MIKSSYNNIVPYQTRDGSTIRELMHPEIHGNKWQSLAEATVPTGFKTVLHKHIQTEEIYHITQGTGNLTIGNQNIEVVTGDTITIPPGLPHQIQNTGSNPLKLLCCCTPPYSHEDTVLLS